MAAAAAAGETDVGITGGGGGSHKIYVGGIADHNIDDEQKVDHIVKLVEKKAAEMAAKAATAPHSSAAE
jgi:(E)-4-hydroxy-3-methylbut-2-enyl-diphosphate synthase